MLDDISTERQNLQTFESLKICNVADHVGRKRKFFAVEKKVKWSVHLFDRRVNANQLDLSKNKVLQWALWDQG